MYIRYYGLFDTVAKNMVSVFTSQNDDVCLRSVVKMVQDPSCDVSLLKDCVCQYLYSLDSQTGKIADNKIVTLFTVATMIEKFGSKDVDSKSLAAISQRFDLIEKAFKSYKDLDSKCQKILDLFSQQLQKIDSKVSDIIGGKIKCQKYKKNRK